MVGNASPDEVLQFGCLVFKRAISDLKPTTSPIASGIK
jgi:hypothetical protein